MESIRLGEVDEGIKTLEEIITTGSGSIKLQAEVGLAYAYFTKGEYDTASDHCKRIIAENPNNKRLVYVYYLRALNKMKQGEAHLQDLMDDIDPENEYPEELRLAYRYYEDLIKRFPQSEYVETSYKQIETIRKELAKYELHIARYEMVEGNYKEAARHAEYVMQYYSDNLSRKYALTILVRAYQELNMPKRAKTAQKQLDELTTFNE